MALEEKERYDREMDVFNQKEKGMQEGSEFPPNGTYRATENPQIDFHSLVEASMQQRTEHTANSFRERRLSSVFQETGNGFSAGGFFGHKQSIDFGNNHLNPAGDSHESPYLSVPTMIHNNAVSPEPRIRQDSFYDDFMKNERSGQPKFEFRKRADSAFSDFTKEPRADANVNGNTPLMDMRDAHEFP